VSLFVAYFYEVISNEIYVSINKGFITFQNKSIALSQLC